MREEYDTTTHLFKFKSLPMFNSRVTKVSQYDLSVGSSPPKAKQKALIRFTSSGLICRAAGQVGWMYHSRTDYQFHLIILECF